MPNAHLVTTSLRTLFVRALLHPGSVYHFDVGASLHGSKIFVRWRRYPIVTFERPGRGSFAPFPGTDVGGRGEDGEVLLDRLAETWTAVAATRSRNAKRDLLAATLAEGPVPGDLEIAVSYLAGSLRQRRPTRLAGSAALPSPAPEASLTLDQVDETFETMAGLSGPGSVNRRAALATDLFGQATEREQAFLRGLVLGDLRQGAMDALVQEGMARAYAVDPAVLRRAAMLLSSTTAAAHLLVVGGAGALAAVDLWVGTPIQPMLAASAPDRPPP